VEQALLERMAPARRTAAVTSYLAARRRRWPVAARGQQARQVESTHGSIRIVPLITSPMTTLAPNT
jgi:hypothetical protein